MKNITLIKNNQDMTA